MIRASLCAVAVTVAIVATSGAALGQGAEDEASLLVREARTALAARDYQLAGELLDRALAANPRQVHVYLLRASVHGVLGDHDRAIALLERALVLAPGSLDVSSALGVQLVLAGRTERGVALLESVVARDRSRYAAQAVLGRHHVKVGRWAAAVSAFEAYLQSRPSSLAGSDDGVRLELARARLRNGQPDEARAAYRAVLGAAPRDTRARLGLLWSTAAIDCRAVPALVDRMADLERRYPAVGLVAGLCALERGRHTEARSRALAYRERAPRDPRGWGLLAAERRAQGDLAGAYDGFARASSLAPNDPRWALELARVERLQGHPAAAAARLRRAGAPVGRRAAWTLELAEALIADGRYAMARAVLVPHVGSHRDDARGHRLLGAALAGMNRMGDAIDALERAVAIGGPQGALAGVPLAESLEARARAALRAREPGAALADATRAAELSPSSARSVLLGVVRLAVGDHAGAIAPLEAATPTVRSLSLLATAYRGAGRSDAAEAAAARAVELPSSDVGARQRAALLLASIRVAAGRGADAVAVLEPWMSRTPDAAVIDAFVVASRAAATEQLRDGAHRSAVRTLGEAERHLAADDPRRVAVGCDLALAATAAGQRETALRRLRQLATARCPYPAPADAQTVPILTAWNQGTEPSRAATALASLERMRRGASGSAQPLWQAAVRDVALRAAMESHRRGRASSARKYLAAARSRGAASAQVDHNHAVMLIDAGKLDDAIRQLLRVSGDVPEAHLNLGIAYEAKGDPVRALRHYERAQAAGVGHPQLAAWIASIRRVWGEP